jgi:hypothetical protein
MKIVKYLKLTLYLILCISYIQCKNSSNNSDTETEYYSETDEYSDGTYCADVEYYYSETGTRSNYTLLVEIENNELVKINWPNGGWLDDSHFSPPSIESGSANFTSDKGVEYKVTILGEENDCDITTYAKDEDELIQEKIEADYQQQREKEEEEYEQKQEEEERRMRLEEEEEN